MLKETILCFVFLLFVGCATTSKTTKTDEGNREIELVEKETVSGKNLDVFFFDPTFLVLKKFSNHNQLDEATKNDQWFDYLHNNIVYVFALKDEGNRYSKYFVVRGNPEITQSARFYKVDIIDNDERISIESLLEGYDTKNLKIIDNIPTRGSLFEHMSYFKTPTGKQYVGQGVKFYGKFMNVTKYEEVKNAILPVIQEELEKNG